MKMNNLQKIHNALTTFKPEVKLDEALRLKAYASLDRMMKITSNKPVEWPASFNG